MKNNWFIARKCKKAQTMLLHGQIAHFAYCTAGVKHCTFVGFKLHGLFLQKQNGSYIYCTCLFSENGLKCFFEIHESLWIFWTLPDASVKPDFIRLSYVFESARGLINSKHSETKQVNSCWGSDQFVGRKLKKNLFQFCSFLFNRSNVTLLMCHVAQKVKHENMV